MAQMGAHQHPHGPPVQNSLQSSQMSQYRVSNKFDNQLYSQSQHSNQMSQQNLAGEFTLQPRQPGQHEVKTTPRQNISKPEDKKEIVQAHE